MLPNDLVRDTGFQDPVNKPLSTAAPKRKIQALPKRKTPVTGSKAGKSSKVVQKVPSEQPVFHHFYSTLDSHEIPNPSLQDLQDSPVKPSLPSSSTAPNKPINPINAPQIPEIPPVEHASRRPNFLSAAQAKSLEVVCHNLSEYDCEDEWDISEVHPTPFSHPADVFLYNLASYDLNAAKDKLLRLRKQQEIWHERRVEAEVNLSRLARPVYELEFMVEKMLADKNKQSHK